MECGDCPHEFYPGKRLVVHSTNIYWALLLNAKVFHTSLGFPGFSEGKESACNVGDVSSIPRSGRASGKGMATHSSILDWRIPWTEDPSGLQSMGLERVRYNWVTNTPSINILLYLYQVINKISKVSPLLDLQEKTCKSVGKFRLRSLSSNISFVAGICYLAQETKSKPMPSLHFYDMIQSLA